jgi:hypothetical protein
VSEDGSPIKAGVSVSIKVKLAGVSEGISSVEAS